LYAFSWLSLVSVHCVMTSKLFCKNLYFTNGIATYWLLSMYTISIYKKSPLRFVRVTKPNANIVLDTCDKSCFSLNKTAQNHSKFTDQSDLKHKRKTLHKPSVSPDNIFLIYWIKIDHLLL